MADEFKSPVEFLGLLASVQQAALEASVLEILTALIDAGTLTPKIAAETAENIMLRLRTQATAVRDAGDRETADLLWDWGEALGSLALPLSSRRPGGAE